MQQLSIPASYQATDIRYAVPSATRPGVTYIVAREPGKFRCSCEAGQHGRGCWHIRAVVSGMVKPHVKLTTKAPQEQASELLWN